MLKLRERFPTDRCASVQCHAGRAPRTDREEHKFLEGRTVVQPHASGRGNRGLGRLLDINVTKCVEPHGEILGVPRRTKIEAIT